MHYGNVHRYTLPCTCTNIMRCIIACASWNARHVKCIIMSASCHMHHALCIVPCAPYHVQHRICTITCAPCPYAPLCTMICAPRHKASSGALHKFICIVSLTWALHHPEHEMHHNCTIAFVHHLKEQDASCFTIHCKSYTQILNLNEQECELKHPTL